MSASAEGPPTTLHDTCPGGKGKRRPQARFVHEPDWLSNPRAFLAGACGVPSCRADTASSLDVNNAALIGGDNVKGGTTGTLIGCTVYSATRTLGNGDTYNVQYEFDLNAA